MPSRLNRATAAIASVAVVSSGLFLATAPAATAATVAPAATQSATATFNPDIQSQYTYIKQFETLINQYRAKYGLNPVAFNADPVAFKDADDWVKNLAATQEGSLHRPESNINYKGYGIRAETVAATSIGGVDSLFTQWMTSESHRQALLAPDATSYTASFYTVPSGTTNKYKFYGTVDLYSALADNMPNTYANIDSYMQGGSTLPLTDTSKLTASYVAPTWKENSYVIPVTKGVNYWDNTNMRMVSAGEHSVNGRKIKIVPIAQDGYRLPTVTDAKNNPKFGWANDFKIYDGNEAVIAPTPTADYNNRTIKFDLNARYDYKVNGQVVSDTYYAKAGEKVKVTVDISRFYQGESYFATSSNEWEFSFGNVVEPKFVTFDPVNFTYTVPTVTGVNYYINGTLTSAGKYNATGDQALRVTVAPTAGNDILYQDSYTQDYIFPSKIKKVTPTAPTFKDNTYTIPSVEGVKYMINGATVAAGKYTLKGNESVSIKAAVTDASKYELASGSTTSWSYTYKVQSVATTPVTFDDDTYTFSLPEVTGISYLVNGKAYESGTYSASAGQNTTVTVVNKIGYQATGTTTWTHNFEALKSNEVVAAAPTVKTDGNKLTLTIPSSSDVRYYMDDEALSAGTKTITDYDSYIELRAEALNGKSLRGIDRWIISNGVALKPVIATAPTINEAKKTITIPNTPNVYYYVNYGFMAPGTHELVPDSDYGVNVVAETDDGAYYIIGGDTWYWDFSPETIDVKNPSFNTSTQTMTLPAIEGADWYLNGKKVSGNQTLLGRYTLELRAINDQYVFEDGQKTTWTGQFQKPVTPTAPTVDANNATVTIPSVTGVTYSVNGKTLSAGKYSYTGAVKIAAVASNADLYKLSGTVSWSATIPVSVKASASVNTSTGQYTIPTTTGVKYYVNGVEAKAGTYSFVGTVTVTAKVASSAYKLSGTASWSGSYTKTVKAIAPSFNGSANTVTIPKVTGITYYINGKAQTQGKTYTGYTSTGTVAVKANAGYKLSGATSWSFDNRNTVKPTAPSFSPSANTVKIPKITGVTYYINNKAVAQNKTYTGYSSTGTVTAKASNSAYKLSGTTTWKFDNRNAVKPAKPTFSGSANTVKIPKSTGVTYYINGKAVSQNKTYTGYSSTGTVTTKASSSYYKLSGTTSWKFDNRNAVKPAKPTFSGSGNTVKIPKSTGVKYYINGKAVSQNKTYKGYSSTGTVTAKASSSYYKLSGTTSWKFDNRNAVAVKKPTISTAKNTVKIPKVTGVKYYINNKAVSQNKTYTYKNKTKLTIATKASSSYYRLTGTQKWTVTI